MLVEAQIDRCGNITVYPINDKIRRKFAKYLQKVYTPQANGTAFFQDGMGTADFMEDMKPSQRRDLEAGWPVKFRVDAWVYGHWLGWDAHTLAEKGAV